MKGILPILRRQSHRVNHRIGLSRHYMLTRTKKVTGEWDSAALARSQGRFGHFAYTPRPKEDFDPAAVRFDVKAANAVRDVLFHDARQVRGTA